MQVTNAFYAGARRSSLAKIFQLKTLLPNRGRGLVFVQITDSNKAEPYGIA
jgi:hypothetical protein